MLELDYARRSRRHNVDMICELIRNDCDEPINHRLSDVSAYGAWIETSFPMSEGSHVVIVVTPPVGDDIIVFAQVMRVRRRSPGGSRGGMGVEFIGTTQLERLQLLMWLRHVPDDTVRVMEFGRMIH
jgi:hypothetical protein